MPKKHVFGRSPESAKKSQKSSQGVEKVGTRSNEGCDSAKTGPSMKKRKLRRERGINTPRGHKARRIKTFWSPSGGKGRRGDYLYEQGRDAVELLYSSCKAPVELVWGSCRAPVELLQSSCRAPVELLSALVVLP